jgi:hypothetical protein
MEFLKFLLTMFAYIVGIRFKSRNPNMNGNCSLLKSNYSLLRSNCSDLKGNCSWLSGHCSSLEGNCSRLNGDLSLITAKQRERDNNISSYVVGEE